jgi:hypothetical protein
MREGAEKVEILRKEGPVLIPSLGQRGINAEYPLWNGIFASEFFPPEVQSAYYVLRLFVEVATPAAARAAQADLLQALDLLARVWPFAGGSFMVVNPHEFTTKPAFISNAEEVEQRLLERQGLKNVEVSCTANCEVLVEYAQPPLQTAANIAMALYREPELAKAFEYHQRAWLDYYQHRHQQSSWFSDLYKVREQLKVMRNGDVVGQLSLSSRDWSYFGHTLNDRNSDLRHAGRNSHRKTPLTHAEVDRLFLFARQWLVAHLKSKGLL